MGGQRLTIGKRHRGKLLRDVPAHYLRWLLCNYRQLDDELREQIADELRTRGDVFLEAWTVVSDLEERLTVKLATDEALSHEAAAAACDDVLLAFEQTREKFGVSDGAWLIVPRRVTVDTEASRDWQPRL